MAELNILGEPIGEPLTDAENERLCLKAIRQAAEGDPRWASWWLQHHPATSGTWSDLAVLHRAERNVISRLMRALLSAGLPPDIERRLLLHLHAEGVEVIVPRLRDAEAEWTTNEMME